MRPWSKLQREIYKLLDPKLGLQIHCRAYRMPKSQSTTPQIPRFWVTLGKEIVFDIPRNLEDHYKYTLYEVIPAVNDYLREYVDCPRDKLLQFRDWLGLGDILKAADRRVGKAQWHKLPQTEVVKKILDKRGCTQ